MESSAASTLKFLSPHHNVLVNEKVDVHNVNPSFVQKVYVPIPIHEGQRDFSVSLKTQPNILIGKNFRLNYKIKFTGDNYIPIDPYKMEVFDSAKPTRIYPYIVDQKSIKLWPKQFPLNGVMESCSIQLNKLTRDINPKNIMHPLSVYSDCEEKWPDGCGKITEEGQLQKMSSSSYIQPKAPLLLQPFLTDKDTGFSNSDYRVPMDTEWLEEFENVYPYQDPAFVKLIPSASGGDVGVENPDLTTIYDTDELVTKRTLSCNFSVNEPVFNPILDPLNGSDNFSSCIANVDDFWLRFKLEKGYDRKLLEFVDGLKYYIAPQQIAPYLFEREEFDPEKSLFRFNTNDDKQNIFAYMTHHHVYLDDLFNLPGRYTTVGRENSVEWEYQWGTELDTSIPTWRTEITDLTLSYDVYVPVMSIPPVISSRFNELLNWQQHIRLAGTFDVQSYKTPQPIEFNYVPEKLFIYIKNTLPDANTNSSFTEPLTYDYNRVWTSCANLMCQRIESIKMSVNRGKQILDLKNCADIYTMSKKNGYRGAYNSFHSKTGSIVCIDLTKGDLGDFIPRTRTKFHFTLEMTHRNITGLLPAIPGQLHNTIETKPDNGTWVPFNDDPNRFANDNIDHDNDPRRIGLYQLGDQTLVYPIDNAKGFVNTKFIEDSTDAAFNKLQDTSFGYDAILCVIGSLTGELLIERNRASVSVSNSIEHTNKDMNQQMACYGNYDQSFDTNGPFQSSIDTNTRSNILATCQHLPMRDETALESLVGSKRKR